MKNLLSTIIGTAVIASGATYGAITATTADLSEVKSEKHAILKDNVWKDIRLGEAPEWDISVVSAEEMSSAYVSLANEMNAKETENLYDNLRAKAIEQGIACQTK